MLPFILSGLGQVHRCNGDLFTDLQVDANQVEVTQLLPHIVRFTLKKGEEVNILVRYSCHCWTCAPKEASPHSRLIFMDGNRPRIFDPDRYTRSFSLPDLIANLDKHRIYLSGRERNYGCYNATLTTDGVAYTAFFTLERNKGRFDNKRYKLLMRIESAYTRQQPQKGSKASLSAIIAKAQEGKVVNYRR